VNIYRRFTTAVFNRDNHSVGTGTVQRIKAEMSAAV
jgi:hypothetical protein